VPHVEEVRDNGYEKHVEDERREPIEERGPRIGPKIARQSLCGWRPTRLRMRRPPVPDAPGRDIGATIAQASGQDSTRPVRGGSLGGGRWTEPAAARSGVGFLRCGPFAFERRRTRRRGPGPKTPTARRQPVDRRNHAIAMSKPVIIDPIVVRDSRDLRPG
jgi:hypothetical protein